MRINPTGVHTDLIILSLSWCASSHDEAKNNPHPSPLHLWGVDTNPHRRIWRAVKHTLSCIGSCDVTPLTYIVLLFTGDGVTADFSVLDRCQVPEKEQRQDWECFLFTTLWLSLWQYAVLLKHNGGERERKKTSSVRMNLYSGLNKQVKGRQMNLMTVSTSVEKAENRPKRGRDTAAYIFSMSCFSSRALGRSLLFPRMRTWTKPERRLH